MQDLVSSLIDYFNVGIYVADMDTYQLLFANQSVKQLFGTDIIDKPCYQVFQNRTEPCAFCTNSKLIKDGVPQPPYIWEHQNQRTKRWVKCIDQAINWIDGRHVRLQIAIDIDEMKRMEGEVAKHQEHLQELVNERTLELQQEIAKHKEAMQRLRETQGRYKALVKSLPVGLYQSSPEGVCVYTTNETAKMLGMPVKDMLGPNWTNALHPEDREEVIAKWLHCCKNNKPFNHEYRFVRPDGSIVWVRALANPYIGNDERPWYVGTLIDITKDKEKEEELRVSTERFKKTFINCPSAMCIVNFTNLEYIDVNESWVNLTGYSRQEVVGRKFNKFKIWDDAARIIDLRGQILKNEAFYNEEITIITKNGELRTGLTSAVIINLQGVKCVSIVIHDITEQKKMEKEITRLDRLNLVGQMAAGIGHEVRNPLTTVRGLLQILGEKPECTRYKGHYELMISELDRANSIITEYLSLAKKEVVRLAQHNLNQIIAALEPLLIADALSAKKDIIMQLQPTPDLQLDQKEIRQLILNLVQNGLQAMEPGGKLTLATYVEGEQVVLAVADEGNGIANDTLDKLGTPFFTTKPEGTGLGLATCYSIAERHHAAIAIDTTPQGTTFYVRFKTEA